MKYCGAARRATWNARDERGSATLEFLMLIGVLWLPMMGLIATTGWPERLNASHAAAYEAAKAVVTAADPAAGEDVGRNRAREIMANHGFGSDITVTYTGGRRRGESLTATVTVTLPALTFPGVGRWAAFRHSTSNTQRIGDFRSFG